MQFTSAPPTKPGFYLWKGHEGWPVWTTEVYFTGDRNTRLTTGAAVDPNSGLWCLLLPADSLATSIEEAFREGRDNGISEGINQWGTTHEQAWLTSNARKKLGK